jgi:Lon protease-like protein
MPGFRTRFDDLPSEFPVFPLAGVLLLPRGRLPLNIFEPRYLAMTEDALAHNRMFAMIQPDPGLPETANGPSLYRIGCLGRLTSFSETDDGRLLITLTGLARFSIASEIDMRRGYRRVIGDFSRYRADMNEPDDAAIDREGLLAALRGYFARRSIEPNWDAINRLADDALVVTLAMVCPFEPIEKQALLEAPGDAERADTLLALLRMGAAETGPPRDGTSSHPVS